MLTYSKPRVIIIKGEQHQGKTTFVEQVVKQLVTEGHNVVGFLAPGSFKNGLRYSFDIVDIKTGKSKPLCCRDNSVGEKAGPFIFNEEGQNFGKKLIDPVFLHEYELVVIDELGPLELQEKGWFPSVKALLNDHKNSMIWIIRSSLVEAIISKFWVNDPLAISIADHTVKTAVGLILGVLGKNSPNITLR
jgi:nucleoside-triphosphatase THEP1